MNPRNIIHVNYLNNIAITAALVSNSKMFGFCYTQLYDAKQEQNGLYTYERKPKFSQEIYDKIKVINSKTAEIEK